MSACWSISIYVRGVAVTFFGRQTKANPLLARLRASIDCPIHGARVVRLPNNRFRAELDRGDRAGARRRRQDRHRGTMQAITNVVEGWIREHPEQWLWLHRRWRPERCPTRSPLGGARRLVPLALGRQPCGLPGNDTTGQMRLI